MIPLSRDDDRFRLPGSPYEHDEPVAIVVISRDGQVDWSADAHVPSDTLWLPTTLFYAIAERSLLRHLDICAQTRLDRVACERLCQELSMVVDGSPRTDTSLAATLFCERARRVAESTDGAWLLVEGP